jgi:hypothetical protein
VPCLPSDQLVVFAFLCRPIEDMDLIAERGILLHVTVDEGWLLDLIAEDMGNVICLNNTGFALRVLYFI